MVCKHRYVNVSITHTHTETDRQRQGEKQRETQRENCLERIFCLVERCIDEKKCVERDSVDNSISAKQGSAHAESERERTLFYKGRERERVREREHVKNVNSGARKRETSQLQHR